jgi:predicted MFS family arabinose efflux permease
VILAAMAALSVACTRGLPTLFRAGQEAVGEPLVERLKGGLRFARDHRPVLGGLVLVALANLTCFVYEPMIPAVADEVFGAGPLLFGLFLSATGVGSLLTTLWLSLGGVTLSRPGLVALLAAALLHALQMLFSYADSVAASLGALVCIGMAGTMFSIAHSSLFLVATPDALRGRVLGLQTLTIGTYPLSNLIVGWLGNHLGPLAAVRSMALAGLVWVALLAVLLPALRQRIEEPNEPETSRRPTAITPAA